MTNLITKERIAKISEIKSNPSKVLKGFVRIVSEDKTVSTKGFFFDKNAFEDFLENLEYLNPKFWKEIKSRQDHALIENIIELRERVLDDY